MGLHDRDYLRNDARPATGFARTRLWTFNTWLILINIAIYFGDGMLGQAGVVIPVNMGDAWVQGVTAEQRSRAEEVRDAQRQPAVIRSRSLPGSSAVPLVDRQTGQVVGERRITAMPPLQAAFHFSTAKGFLGLEFWRFIGFQFLHGSFGHLLFNMIGLYFFGGLIENHLGRKRYAAFYLTCGVFGAIAYLLLNMLGNVLPFRAPGLLINDIYTPLIGASAGVFGVLIASAFVAPNAIVLLFFILPMRLWQVAYGFVILAALNLLMSGANAGGDAAHLGGAIAGFYFIRRAHLLRDFFDFFTPRTGGKKKKSRGPSSPFAKRTTPDDGEIDRILAKIASHGLHSLTESEKKTLRRASESKTR